MVYPSVTCEHCKSSPHFDWDVEVDLPLLKALMGSKWPSGAKLKSVELKKEAAGHAKTIMFIPDRGPALSLDALVFRRHINKVKGKEVIKSLRWKADVERGDLVLSGQGWGYHGIGLCQYGSEGKAEKGWSAQQILEAYYPEATIAPAPDLD
jgi:stage II sporulation protein D